MSKINELYEKISLELHADPSLERQLITELLKIISNAHSLEMKSDESFCFRFALPLNPVNRLVTFLKVTTKDIFDAFSADWGPQSMTNKMHSDPYYQILLLIIHYALKEKNEELAKNALLIALFKIWNGRKSNYLKYCDKKIMKYVVTQMGSKRYIFSKYDGPLSMLKEYFVPTLLEKYSNMILETPLGLKRLFEQSWGRINQLFVQSGKTDIKTGEIVSQGGILSLYMKAKEAGQSIDNPTIRTNAEEDSPEFSQYSTVHIREEIVRSVTDAITLNTNVTYPSQIINFINRKTTVSSNVITEILRGLHNHQFHDGIYDAISIILSRLNLTDKNEICVPNFYDLIQKNIISSKNNEEIRNLQKIIGNILKMIFTTILNKDVNVFSGVQQIHLRNVLIYGLAFNINRTICRGSSS